MQPAPSAGKRVQKNFDWFWFYPLLVDKVAQDFFSQSQSVAMQNQNNCKVTFDRQLKTALFTFCHEEWMKECRAFFAYHRMYKK